MRSTRRLWKDNEGLDKINTEQQFPGLFYPFADYCYLSKPLGNKKNPLVC